MNTHTYVVCFGVFLQENRRLVPDRATGVGDLLRRGIFRSIFKRFLLKLRERSNLLGDIQITRARSGV